VPSTVFTLKGRSYWFFNDVALDFVGSGLVTPDPAGGPCSYGKPPADPSTLWRTEGSDAVKPADPTSEQYSFVIGVLPQGARDPQLTLGAEASQQRVNPLTGTGQLAFIAYGITKDDQPELVTQVRFVDGGGSEVVVPFTYPADR
jgi:hypothetical protein